MQKVSTEELYDIFKKHRNITTDTRKVKSGDLFFGLKGPKFNGNLFAKDALTNGASFAVVDDPTLPENPGFLLVDDVLKSLQELAEYHRDTFKFPVIGITGSNGKTTTKELIHRVLSSIFKTSTTKGNLNNHIGIPLTILAIPDDTEMAVIEMGANHQKEIEDYCRYTKPDYGLITNCGKAHLEGFGGIQGVQKGKGELFDFLKKNNRPAFICADFDYFHKMVEDKKMDHIIWYGTKGEDFVSGKVEELYPFLSVKILSGFANPYSIKTNLVGDYNIYNVLAAVAIGKHFGVPGEMVKNAIESYEPDNNRSQFLNKDGYSIILDAYNANPSSMSAAITNFANLPVNHKVLMLGAMAELGDDSLNEHKALIQLIQQYKWEQVILVGGDFGNTDHDFLYFPNADEVKSWWKNHLIKNSHVLLKGSRSIGMERVIEI